MGESVKDLANSGVLNLEDLEINQQLFLSKKQKRILRFFELFWLGCALANIPLLLLSLYFFVMIQNIWQSGVLMIPLMIYMSILSAENAKVFSVELIEGKVERVSGKIYKKYSISGGRHATGSCMIYIKNRVFSVHPGIYEALQDDETYSFYYTPHSNRLLNIKKH
jgi:hypothetical protein